jgi:hypothetical protein
MAIDERANMLYIAKDHGDADLEAGLRDADVPEVEVYQRWARTHGCSIHTSPPTDSRPTWNASLVPGGVWPGQTEVEAARLAAIELLERQRRQT